MKILEKLLLGVASASFGNLKICPAIGGLLGF
jgi:hypothetical protein